MYGIPDLMIPRLSFHEFGKSLFLPTIIVVSDWRSNQHGNRTLREYCNFSIFHNLEFLYSAKKISFWSETF